MTGCRCVLLSVVLLAGACSNGLDNADYYGYEDAYAVPAPDMVVHTPDDKPGKTVDEMLGMAPHTVHEVEGKVTVEKAKPVEKPIVYERAGRFGSKEKISLRKGLNVPESDLIYSPKTRAPSTAVRGLQVKEPVEKDDLVFKSEQEMLAEIIAPKKQELEVIEVVENEQVEPAAVMIEKTVEPEVLPVKKAETVERPASLKAPVEIKVEPISAVGESIDLKPAKTADVKPQTQLISPLVAQPVAKEKEPSEKIVLKAPTLEFTQPEAAKIQLVEPESTPYGFTLIPPPATNEDVAITQFVGMIEFNTKKVSLPTSGIKVVREAVKTLKASPKAKLQVIGYDAPNGNKDRALKRAQTVASALKKAGIKKSQIKVIGETTAPYGYDYGAHVEIYLED